MTTIGILVLVTIIAFEAMAVTAALPTAVEELHALGSFGWAYTAYLASSIIGMITCGQLSDSRGPQIPMLIGLIGFITGLVVSGGAIDMPMFVAGRFVQGFCGGMLITVVYVVVGQVYPEQLHAKALAVSSMAWVVPSLVGPVLAGFLAQHVSWRLVFLGLLPLAAIGSVLLAPVVRSLHEPNRRLPSRGLLLPALVIAAAIAILEEVGQRPPRAWFLWPAIVVAVAGLGWSLGSLLPKGTLSFALRRNLHSSVAAVGGPVGLRGLIGGAVFALEATIPLTMQRQHHYGATLASVPLTVGAVSWAAAMWWESRHIAGVGTIGLARRIRIGFSVVMTSALFVAVVSQVPSPAWLIYPVWTTVAVGSAFAFASINVLLLRFTTDEDRGADSAALLLSDAIASTVVIGFAGVLTATAARGSLTYGAAFAIVDVTVAGMALVGALATARLAALDDGRIAAAVRARRVSGQAGRYSN